MWAQLPGSDTDDNEKYSYGYFDTLNSAVEHMAGRLGDIAEELVAAADELPDGEASDSLTVQSVGYRSAAATAGGWLAAHEEGIQA